MITMDTCGIFRLVPLKLSCTYILDKVRYGKFKIRMIQSKPERPSRELWQTGAGTNLDIP